MFHHNLNVVLYFFLWNLSNLMHVSLSCYLRQGWIIYPKDLSEKLVVIAFTSGAVTSKRASLLIRHQLLDLTSQLTSCTTMKAKAREAKGLISKRRMRSILKRWKAKLGPPPLGTLLPIVR